MAFMDKELFLRTSTKLEYLVFIRTARSSCQQLKLGTRGPIFVSRSIQLRLGRILRNEDMVSGSHSKSIGSTSGGSYRACDLPKSLRRMRTCGGLLCKGLLQFMPTWCIVPSRTCFVPGLH